MSINDSSRNFNPSAPAPAAASASVPPPSSTSSTPASTLPPPTATTTAPPPQPTQATQAPLATYPAHEGAHAGGLSTGAAGSSIGGGSVTSGDGPYPISAFVLKQGGAYQAYVTVRWTTSDGRSGVTERLGSSIGFNHTGSRSLRQKGIPEGARVRIALDVTLGKHSEAREEFIFDPKALTSAFYTSGGTSLTAEKLHLVVADNDDE